MAWSASKVFAFAQLQMGKAALNLSTDSYKVALYNNSITPDNTVTTAVLTEYNGAGSQWLIANEISQVTQWPAGGESLTSVTWTQASNVDTFTAANTQSGSAATLVGFYGCLVYDTSVSSEGLAFLYFGGTQTVTAGQLTVVYNAAGIATWTC